MLCMLHNAYGKWNGYSDTMRPMRRLIVIVFGASLVGIAALLSAGIQTAYAASPPGCPSAPATPPAPNTANYACPPPDNGSVVDGFYVPPNSGDIAGNLSTDPVCIALPIKSGSQNQGRCSKGQVEINNNAGTGGAIIEYLKAFLFVLNGLVGGIIVLVLVLAGVQYITSAGDPGRIKNAKGRVQAAMTGLVLYLMMYAILNFLIPGGVL